MGMGNKRVFLCPRSNPDYNVSNGFWIQDCALVGSINLHIGLCYSANISKKIKLSYAICGGSPRSSDNHCKYRLYLSLRGRFDRGNLFRKGEIAELVPNIVRNLAPVCFGFASQLHSQRQFLSLGLENR